MNMKHFSPEEFHGQLDFVAADTLIALVEFRELWAAKVYISPAPGAVARWAGGDNASQHNVDRWGETRAIDTMPEGIQTAADFERAIECAKRSGFTGIGVYPAWKPRPGLHLDTRHGVGRAAVWGEIRQHEEGKSTRVYVGIAQALSWGAKQGLIA